MPLEGHWKRTSTPLYQLSKRERTVAVVAVLLTTVTIALLVLLTIGDRTAPTRPGCIAASVPGVVGGSVPVDACGAHAQAVCASHARQTDAVSRAIDAECRRAGLL